MEIEHAYATQQDLQETQVADIRQGILACIHQRQTIEYQAGGGHIIPIRMVENA